MCVCMTTNSAGVCLRSFNNEKRKKNCENIFASAESERTLYSQKSKKETQSARVEAKRNTRKKSFRNTLILFFARFHFHSTAIFPTIIIIYNICVIYKFVCQLDFEAHARNNFFFEHSFSFRVDFFFVLRKRIRVFKKTFFLHNWLIGCCRIRERVAI